MRWLSSATCACRRNVALPIKTARERVNQNSAMSLPPVCDPAQDLKAVFPIAFTDDPERTGPPESVIFKHHIHEEKHDCHGPKLGTASAYSHQ